MKTSPTFHLKHSSVVYERRRASWVGPYAWKYPREAWAALSEAFPWEGLALSIVFGAVLWRSCGSDVGGSLGICIALCLGVLQLLLTKSFVTDKEIVRQSGLFLRSRKVTPLADVLRGRVVPLGGSAKGGDVVLETPSGDVRLRSLSDPETVLERIICRRNAATNDLIP
jgi:hypothetical protein